MLRCLLVRHPCNCATVSGWRNSESRLLFAMMPSSARARFATPAVRRFSATAPGTYQFSTVNSVTFPYDPTVRLRCICGAKIVRATQNLRIPRSGYRFDSGIQRFDRRLTARRTWRSFWSQCSRRPRCGMQMACQDEYRFCDTSVGP